MLQLKRGKSYLWIFPIFAVVFSSGCAVCAAFGNPGFGFVILPAFGAFLLFCQCRSGIALDSWWRATYPKGSWQYQAVIAWQILAITAFLIMSCILIVNF